MMIYAVALNRYMLLVFTAGILIGTLGIFTEQIVFLTQHYSAEFITEEIKLEDDIALLMALYGVFLDKRRWVVHFQVADDASDATKAFADDTQKTGIALILIAIIVKVIDMFFMSMNTWGWAQPLLFIWKWSFCLPSMLWPCCCWSAFCLV